MKLIRGDIYMSILKPLFFGAIIVLCVISSALALNCGGTRMKDPADNQAVGTGGIASADLTSDTPGGIAPQGGTLTETQYGESAEPGSARLQCCY